MLLVTYDLRKPGKDYSSLIELLKTATSWARPAESVWLLRTDQDCATWRDKIMTKVDSNDLVLVIEVKQHWAATGISQDVIDWLKNPANWG